MTRLFSLIALASLCCLLPISSATEPENFLKFLLLEDFSAGSARWKPGDAKAWKVEETEKGPAYRLFGKSKYQPPVRSPHNIALLKDVKVSDFVLTAKVRSTTRDYGHRDVCLFFGYQDPSHFYYVHFGKKTDNAANQIFLVNGAPRLKISDKTTAGTPWTDGWHTLRVERNIERGTIRTFFDNMKEPVMTATDKRFTWGQIGIGSFDDTADFAEIQLEGVVVNNKKPSPALTKGENDGSR